MVRFASASAVVLALVLASPQSGGGLIGPCRADTGGGDLPLDPTVCTTFCPPTVGAGGVSGQRRGPSNYIATSWGPAGPLNTGYYAAPDFAGQALSQDCPSKLESDTVYTWCEWNDGLVVSDAKNVVIHGCIIHGHPKNYYAALLNNSDVKIEYCEVRPPATVGLQGSLPGGDATTSQFGVLQNIGTGTVVLRHVEIWGFGNAVTMRSGRVTLDYVWIHDPRNPDPNKDHTDGYLDNQLAGEPPATLVVSHSTVAASANGNAIGQQGQPGGYRNTRITQSYFSGFSWTVNLCAKGEGCQPDQGNVFTDNQFGDDFRALWGNLYGRVYGHFTWRRNTWLNTKGGWDAAHAASHNGKYVLPDGTLSPTDFAGN